MWNLFGLLILNLIFSFQVSFDFYFLASSMSTDMILICEYQSKNISCPADQVIEMVYANYGRTSSRPCAWGTHQDTNCTLPSSTNVAREYCDGHNSCELVAKNSMWKVNPCPGIIKYVELKYICNLIPPKGKYNWCLVTKWILASVINLLISFRYDC